jgi:hypothetical protein
MNGGIRWKVLSLGGNAVAPLTTGEGKLYRGGLEWLCGMMHGRCSGLVGVRTTTLVD